MKHFRLIALACLLGSSAPSAHALVGGPWDHLVQDQFSRQNSNGVYEASITMRNGSGFIRFINSNERSNLTTPDETQTTSSTDLFFGTQSQTQSGTVASLAARSNAVVFFRGNAYFGTVFGTVSLRGKTVVGGGGGQSAVVDQVESAVAGLAQQINAFVNLTGFSESMNLTFNGRVTDQVPEVRFEASGQAVFFSRPQIQVSLVAGGVNIEDLYQISLAPGYAGGPIRPDFDIPMRLVGGRISLETTFGATNPLTSP